MAKIVLYPSELSQWHALVNDAQSIRSCELGEDLESYLVFLLMRFANKPEMIDSVLAMEYLQSQQCAGQDRQDQLRDVGDKCLLFSGLFPGQADRRRVQLSVFVDIGQSAYGLLSEVERSKIADLFANLSERFISMMDVLQAIRELPEDAHKLLPLNAIEVWQQQIHRKH